MPAFRKEYVPLTGTGVVRDAALSFVRVLLVARSGIELTRVYTDEPGNGQFVYYPEQGLFVFDPENPFNAAYYTSPDNAPPETVTVVYIAASQDPGPPTPPITCAPSGTPTFTVPANKQIRVTTPTVGNYAVRLMGAGSVCGDTVIQEKQILSGDSVVFNFLPQGTYMVCVARVCAPGFESSGVLIGPMVIINPPPNYTVTNAAPSGFILAVSPLVTLPSQLPIGPGEHRTKDSVVYTGPLTVRVSLGFGGFRYLKTLINGVVTSSVSAVNGDNNLPSVAITAFDTLEIIYSDVP